MSNFEDHHDWRKYDACMQEIKRRTDVCRQALAPYFREKKVSVANLDLAAVQLRKIYELVAFSALAANKRSYTSIRSRFEKDWRISEIIKVISGINPGFLPRAVKDINGTIYETPDLYFDEARILKWHGELGVVLHAMNPYKAQPNYRLQMEMCAAHLDRIVKILSKHKVEVVPQEVMYIVTMQSITDGSVQVAVFECIEGAKYT